MTRESNRIMVFVMCLAILLAISFNHSSAMGPRSASPERASQGFPLTFFVNDKPVAQVALYSLSGGQFCFEVRNTSPIGSPQIIGIVFKLGGQLTASGFTQAGAGGFRLEPQPAINGFNIGYDFGLVARELGTTFDGIPAGSSSFFCVTANFADITADEIVRSLLLVFESGFGGLCDSSFPLGGPVLFSPEVSGSIGLFLTSSSRVCFTVANEDFSDGVLTGIEFNFSGAGGLRGPFALVSVVPSPQPGNQNLVFIDRSLLGQPQNLTNYFALVTGQSIARSDVTKGIQPGDTSARFCVCGDFSGLDEKAIVSDVRMHFESTTRGSPRVATCSASSPPSGGGLTGVLAGEPR